MFIEVLDVSARVAHELAKNNSLIFHHDNAHIKLAGQQKFR